MELVTANRMKSLRRDKRTASRRPLVVRARVSWKDQRGTTRVANVITRNVSDEAVYVEWREPSAIPLYRLVQFQVGPEGRHDARLPEPLRSGKVLSAVLRVGQRRAATGTPEGYALRLLVDPGQKADQPLEVHDPPLVSATAIA
jgi:hypothetical protein